MKYCGIILACLLLIAAGIVSAATGAEDEMKAAVVFAFLRYSEWPADAAKSGPLVVGVAGPSSFLSTLKRVVEGKTAANRRISVQEFNNSADARSYDVVYFADSSGGEGRQVSAVTARATQILTIGDSPAFLDSGGAIRLMLLDGRIAFEVRLDALERTGVTISSKLLRFGQVRKAPARRG